MDKSYKKSSKHKTNQRTNSRSRTQSQDLDQLFTVDQIVRNNDLQEDDIKISKQQGQLIQKILEIARKGKINSTNAFDIQLKVLDPHVYGKTNQFWKFASDLLKASMNIYDKRVQSLTLKTTKMNNGISRYNTDGGFDDDNLQEDLQQREERIEKRKQQNKNLILQMDIAQYNRSNDIQRIDIGMNTLEQPRKINILRQDKQFIKDPLQNKKLKAFDNSQAKSLFLNVFQLSDKSLNLKLLDEQQSAAQQVSLQNNVGKQFFAQDLVKKMWIGTSAIAQTTQTFNQISKFIKNQKEEIQKNPINNFLDSISKNDNTIDISHQQLRRFLGLPQPVIKIAEKRDINNLQNQNNQKTYHSFGNDQNQNDLPQQNNQQNHNFSFVDNQNQNTTIFDLFKDANNKNYELQKINLDQNQDKKQNGLSFKDFDIKTNTLTNYQLSLGQYQSFSDINIKKQIIMNPYEMDFSFKQGKLIKKRHKVLNQTQSLTNKPKKTKNKLVPQQIDFENDQILNINILKCSKVLKKSKQQKYVSNKDKNLVPKSLFPYDLLKKSQIEKEIEFRKIFNNNAKLINSFKKSKELIQANDLNNLNNQETNFYELQKQEFNNSFNQSDKSVNGAQDKSRIPDYTHNTQQNFDFIFGGGSGMNANSFLQKQAGNQKGYASIRSIKPALIQKIEKQEKILLSELEWTANISFQSMIIVFLNLANEKGYTVTQINEQDVMISLTQ